MIISSWKCFWIFVCLLVVLVLIYLIFFLVEHCSLSYESVQITMYDLTLTVSQNDFKGFNINNSNFSLNDSLGLLYNPTVAEEMFQKSLNMSYIGHISGNKQLVHKIKFEELEEPIITTSNNKEDRIDFSQLKMEQTQQLKKSLIKYQDAKFGYIRSFSKENKELFIQGGCLVCSTNEVSGKCQLELLSESTLQIYLPNQEGEFVNLFIAFNFDTITAKINYDEIPSNKEIEIIAGKYRLVFEFEDSKITEWWYQRLQKMISQSKGNKFSLISLLVRGQDPFYKEKFETESYFVNNCETGDILLFQDNHFFAKAQRFFTRSDFDHVGMVVKDTNYGILIFEANSGRGVSLTPWKYVVKFQWYKTIPKISWRRLQDIEKGRQFNEVIQKFIISNLQKHYHISFAKMFAQQSVLRHPLQTKRSEQGQLDQVTKNDESGFFCSELVATIYKDLELLTRDRSSPNYQPACKFIPKDFSQKSGRRLDKGELSPQYTIYFDEILLKQAYGSMIP